MNRLTFVFNTTECNGWPKIRMLIDDDLYEDHHFVENNEQVNVPIELLDGNHSLTIEIYGKTSNNTIIDNVGHIVKDQLIELIDIYADNIKLPDLFKYIGVYKFNDQEYPQATTWGCNGLWIWNFATPLLTWALDKQIANRESYNPPIILFKDRIVIEQEKIQRLQTQLNNI